MNDIVINSGEYDLVIEGDEQCIAFQVFRGIKSLEQHFVWLSKDETLKNWLRNALENPNSAMHDYRKPCIADERIYLGSDRRQFVFFPYGFKRSQIIDAIKAAFTPEKPRLIFAAEDGQRYEWIEGNFRRVGGY